MSIIHRNPTSVPDEAATRAEAANSFFRASKTLPTRCERRAVRTGEGLTSTRGRRRGPFPRRDGSRLRQRGPRPWAVSRSVPNGSLGLHANNTAMKRSPCAIDSGIRILPKRQPGDTPPASGRSVHRLHSIPLALTVSGRRRSGSQPLRRIRIRGAGTMRGPLSCIRRSRPASSRLDDLHCSSSLDCYG